MSHGIARNAPVVTLDGYARAGKGTARRLVAIALGFGELDSGVLYRAVALRAKQSGVSLKNISGVVRLARSLRIVMEGENIFLSRRNVTEMIRSQEIGSLAAKIAPIQDVRDALRDFQLDQWKEPGLVADGRDQAFIFEGPNTYSFFIFADAKVRAQRQVEEDRRRGQKSDLNHNLLQILQRDEIDRTRDVAPLVKHPKAIDLDTTHMDRTEVMEFILHRVPFKRVG